MKRVTSEVSSNPFSADLLDDDYNHRGQAVAAQSMHRSKKCGEEGVGKREGEWELLLYHPTMDGIEE